MVRINSVIPESPAYRAGARAGDDLVRINGHEVRDVLDYMYYAAETSVVMELLRDGEPLTLHRLPSSSRAYPLALEKKAEAYRRMFAQAGIVAQP